MKKRAEISCRRHGCKSGCCTQ